MPTAFSGAGGRIGVGSSTNRRYLGRSLSDADARSVALRLLVELLKVREEQKARCSWHSRLLNTLRFKAKI